MAESGLSGENMPLLERGIVPIVKNGSAAVNFRNGKNPRGLRAAACEKARVKGKIRKKMLFFRKNGQEKLEMTGKEEYNIWLYVKKRGCPAA